MTSARSSSSSASTSWARRTSPRRSRICAISSSMSWSAGTFPETAYAEQWDTKALDGSRSTASSASSLPIDAVGRRGRHRRPGDQRAHPQGRSTRRPSAKAAELGAELPPDREDGAAADARPSVARASRHARASAPGHRLPRLRPARSAERVQVRGFVLFESMLAACARTSPASSCTSSWRRPRSSRLCSRSSCRRCRPITSIRSPASTSSNRIPSWRWPMPRSQAHVRAAHAARAREARAAADPQAAMTRSIRTIRQPGDAFAQRAVPVRLGQEVQALPRQDGLSRRRKGAAERLGREVIPAPPLMRARCDASPVVVAAVILALAMTCDPVG